MKKKIFILFCFLTCFSGVSQVIPLYNATTSYNYESEGLEGRQSDLVLAFSMRKLFVDYSGPLIRLRRAGDNAVKDFYPAAVSGIVDVNAIDEWRGTNDVTVVIWYNQNDATKHAVQNTLAWQPLFTTDPDIPYFKGDGVDDHLVVSASTKLELTDNGAQGSVFTVLKATRKEQYSFGYQNPSNSHDRWSTHISWSIDFAYYDLGRCCSQPRRHNNAAGHNTWKAYTIIRRPTSVFVNINAASVYTTSYDANERLLDSGVNFYLLNALPGASPLASTVSFSEFIMYNTDVTLAMYSAIEADQVSFWKLN